MTISATVTRKARSSSKAVANIAGIVASKAASVFPVDMIQEQAETAKLRADRHAEQEANLRKQSQRAELAALQASNDALQSLGQANLAQLRSLWGAKQPGRQAKAFQMQWCLDCHRNPAPNLRPPEMVTRMDWSGWDPEQHKDFGRLIVKAAGIQPKNLDACTVCHR